MRYLLVQSEAEDRLATYAQICGEYLRGTPVRSFEAVHVASPTTSELDGLSYEGFYVANRKPRNLFQDEETLQLVQRIEERLRQRATQQPTQ